MKASLPTVLLLLAASLSPAQRHYTESQVITYAKNVDVHMLDPSLPSQRLEEWLLSGPPHAQIRWDLADSCDEKPDERNFDYPICAKIWFARSGEAGSFLVQVGSRHKGIVGNPQLFNPIISWEDGPGWIMTGAAEHLSGLPTLLDQPAYAHSVGQLYDEIVAHHPIGIPSRAEMVTIQPFLSKRLFTQIQTARDCEADYFQQHAATNIGQEPTWLKSGIFSGDANRGLPVSAWPVREGLQKDGSFLVLVNLFAQTINLGNGLKGGSASGGSWHVVARVISEDGHFVIDDIRFFNGDKTDGPSHLLSESFGGCNGPHWTGNTSR